jgi:hypothetical protein
MFSTIKILQEVKGLTDRGYKVTAVNDTLPEALAGDTPVTIEGASLTRSISAGIVGMQRTSPCYKAVALPAVKTLTETVDQSTGYIRKTIIPMCEAYAAEISNFIDHADVDMMVGFKVYEMEVPEWVYDSYIGFKQNASYSSEIDLALNVTFIMDDFKTFLESFAVKYIDWFNQGGEQCVHKAVRGGLFSSTIVIENIYGNQYVDTKPDVINFFDHVLAGLLITKFLEATNLVHVRDGESNYVTLQLKRNTISLFSILKRRINVIERAIRLNRLVVVRQNPVLSVNKRVLEEYYAKGGTIDALLGIIVTNDERYANLTRLDDIIANQIELTAIFKKHVGLKTRAHQLNNRQMLATIARDAVDVYINKVDYPSFISKEDSRTKAYNCIDCACKEGKDIEPYEFAKHVIAKQVFFFTNAYKFLNYMEAAQKDDKALSQIECAWLANVQLYCEYAADSLTIEKY